MFTAPLLAMALQAASPAAAPTVRWEETDTHRIKIKSEGGLEIARWEFPKDKSPGPDGRPRPIYRTEWRDEPGKRVKVRFRGAAEVGRWEFPAEPSAGAAPARAGGARAGTSEPPAGGGPDIRGESISTVIQMARARSERGEHVQAADLLVDAARKLQADGRSPDGFATVLVELAGVYVQLGKFEGASQTFEQCLEVLGAIGRARSPMAADAMVGMAQAKAMVHDDKAAEDLLIGALAVLEHLHGTNHPAVGNVVYLLALIHHQRKAYPKADKLYMKALSIFTEAQAIDHPASLKAHSMYIQLLDSQQRFFEAKNYRSRLGKIQRGELKGKPRVDEELPEFKL